jgi:fucose permease
MLGASWRASFAVVGVVLGLAALAKFQRSAREQVNEDEPDERDEGDGLLVALLDALRDPRLVAWLLGVALCDLFDEIFVVFASLHARGVLEMGTLGQSAIVASFMIGAAAGLFAIERLLRIRAERWLLVAAAISTVAAFVPWLAASSPVAAIVLAAPVGAASAPLYPLAAAQAYAQRPEKSGSVLAAGHLFTPLGLALPWLVGLVADAAGTSAALALLVVQPLGLIALVVTSA